MSSARYKSVVIAEPSVESRQTKPVRPTAIPVDSAANRRVLVLNTCRRISFSISAIKEAAKYQTEIYVPQRVLDWCDFMNIRVSTPPNDNHDPRQYIDEE